ncbi:MAG: hypothetical protein ACLP0J_10075 [Solirubrobacteraceae bacterium]
MQTILDAQHRLRDRFLFALLFETGMRVGQALGLRHEDSSAGSGGSRSAGSRGTRRRRWRGRMSLDTVQRMLTPLADVDRDLRAPRCGGSAESLSAPGCSGLGGQGEPRVGGVPAAGERASWSACCRGMVRVEFREEVFVAPVGSPLLGAGCVLWLAAPATGITPRGVATPGGRCARHRL